MKQMLKRMAQLIALCIKGPGGKTGAVLYVVVLALELAFVLVSLRLITWTKEFYDALQQLNAAEAGRQIFIFGLIVVVEVARNLTATYLRKLLVIRWREALTSQILDRWLANKAYWRMNQAVADGAIDNPDQRIAEDCRLFLAGPATDHGNDPGIIPLSMDIVTKVVGLASYIAVLWSLSSFPLAFSLFGFPVEISRYMVWAAFIYVALASGLTHLLGAPLKKLYFNQQRREADYRFALARMRDNTDAIAIAGGESSERNVLDRLFDGIIGNWRRLIGRELILSSFTYPYRFTVLRMPTFIALPAYFAGHVTFGGLMQLGNAFSQVVTTLSWFIFSYRYLADLAAATSRLGRFLEATEEPVPTSGIEVGPSGGNDLRIRDLTLRTPQNRRLLSIPSLEIHAGEVVWLRGASGIGKTTLLKTIAGFWSHGEGKVLTPDASRMFLSQKPYMPLADCAEILAYPRRASEFPAADIERALRDVDLVEVASRPAGPMGAASAEVSGGEAQRMMLARLLLHRPQWAFLDEATSALDVDAEKSVYALLRRELPGTTFVVVSHREPLGFGHVRTVDVGKTKSHTKAHPEG